MGVSVDEGAWRRYLRGTDWGSNVRVEVSAGPSLAQVKAVADAAVREVPGQVARRLEVGGPSVTSAGPVIYVKRPPSLKVMIEFLHRYAEAFTAAGIDGALVPGVVRPPTMVTPRVSPEVTLAVCLTGEVDRSAWGGAGSRSVSAQELATAAGIGEPWCQVPDSVCWVKDWMGWSQVDSESPRVSWRV